MQAIREITKWDWEYQPNHTYLMDGYKAVAYIRKGTTIPVYFTTPMTINKRGRQFVTLKKNPFKNVVTSANIVRVAGSKGNVYEVDTVEKTCTCPGWLYRNKCKHLAEYING